MTQAWETVALVLGLRVMWLAGLVARLAWQAVRFRDHQKTLVEVAARLPDGGDVEIDDVDRDGCRLRVRIAKPRQHDKVVLSADE